MTKQDEREALLAKLKRLSAEDDSLHDDGFTESLPLLPPLPEAPGEVVAVFIPKRPRSRVMPKKEPD